jgi:hypothetical protein
MGVNDPPARGVKIVHAELQASANARLRDRYGLFNVAAGPANERPLLFIHNREKPEKCICSRVQHDASGESVMLKQLKQSAPRMLVGVLILSAVALPVIIEIAAANPPQNASLGLREALNISKKTLGVENEGSADPGEFFKTADPIPAQGSRDKVWTVQFRPPPEFPSGQPFGFGDHSPFGAGAPGFGTGRPGMPEGGPPRAAPKRDCLEDINRQMGFYAYTKSKLQLTDGQKAAWKAVEDSFDSEMPKMRLLCETLPNEVVGLPSIIERSDFIERTLAVKLELVRALKVPMQQLVEQLTSAQRAVLDVPPPLPPF